MQQNVIDIEGRVKGDDATLGEDRDKPQVGGITDVKSHGKGG